MGALHEQWERYRDRVDFVVVYIREAHPEDGWVVSMNRDEDIAFDDPTTTEERTEAAASCAIGLRIRMPVVVDEIDDALARAYGALPDRLYLVGRGARIVYQGAPGPFGFDPAALEAAIQSELSS